jgi:uncharacterized damage-inducible protein DinB
MKEELLSILENSRNYTLAVAEAMPEKSYDSCPAGAVWGFGELLNHIAYGIEWWQENYVKGNKADWAPPTMKNDKKSVTANLGAAYIALQDTISKSPMEDKAVKGFHATLDHITHHRGQAALYLRCRGITPPEYTY